MAPDENSDARARLDDCAKILLLRRGDPLMDRRTFIRAITSTIAAPRIDAFAQPADRIFRIGILRPTAKPKYTDESASEILIPRALEKLGYVQGRNLNIDWRYGGGDIQTISILARELVQKRVDVIVAVAATAVHAAKEATATIPIVMWGNFDPVASGFVASLARPGRNVTGVLIAPDGTLGAKKLELLKQAVPRARRIAVLAPQDPTSANAQLPELRQAATALQLELPVVVVNNSDYADSFARIATTRSDALFVIASTYFVGDRKPIIQLTKKYRLPSMWEWREQVVDGGLMAYGTSLAARYERIAEYVHRILKGANPGEMPVDRPTKLELVINLNTAKALELTIPQSLLVRADEVIQ